MNGGHKEQDQVRTATKKNAFSLGRAFSIDRLASLLRDQCCFPESQFPERYMTVLIVYEQYLSLIHI